MVLFSCYTFPIVMAWLRPQCRRMYHNYVCVCVSVTGEGLTGERMERAFSSGIADNVCPPTSLVGGEPTGENCL